jgi:hypothetical protein
MENRRAALWLILVSQALFLASSLIEPPQSAVIFILRVVVPLVIVAYIVLVLTGYASRGKE